MRTRHRKGETTAVVVGVYLMWNHPTVTKKVRARPHTAKRQELHDKILYVCVGVDDSIDAYENENEREGGST
jgi:hypothetical protein